MRVFYILGFLILTSFSAIAAEPATVQVDKVTIAVGKLTEMAQFYTKTFGAELKQVDAYGGKMYAGKLGSIELLLCPKEIAGIKSNESTIQIRLVVADLEKTIASAVANGGSKNGDVQTAGGAKYGSVRDPDGNSIELVQKADAGGK